MVTQTVRSYPTTEKQNLAISKQSSRYTSQSELYHLKGGFEAEVIKSPLAHLLKDGTYSQAFRELQLVTMKAFEKPLDDTHIYAPKEVMDKNVLTADWLIVVRKNNRVIAFSSASFVTHFLVCLNSAMVDSNYQSTGIGLTASALLWSKIHDEASCIGIRDLDYVCRTHNKNVASIMLQVLNNSNLSTETNGSDENKKNFKKVTNYLKCHYNKATGISKFVYPEGLPTGYQFTNSRVNEAFEAISDRDAVYVGGQLNKTRINKILTRNILSVEQHENKGLIEDHHISECA